jgi:hypothetical protein
MTFLRWIVIFGALIYSVLPSVTSAQEYRSREVTREFSGNIRVPRPDKQAVPVPVM